MNEVPVPAAEELPAVEGWLETTEQSLFEVAMGALGTSDGHVLARASEAPSGMSGAYVQLISESTVASIGVCAPDEGLRALAAALLGGGEISQADLTDSVGEIVNMVVGAIKRRMAGRDAGLRLGLPMWVHGHLQATERQRLRASFVRLAGVCDLVLVVLHAPRSGRFDPGP